uniref:Streptogramin lyase n=1 Tax=uncultured marine thaumarchaeote KM3_16_C10 TaxID=1456042 RepID=A0A075GPB2_9ARCH|nr:Streptogramin lyase [uncultured marine thaumarchaeote KM3_16_C10]
MKQKTKGYLAFAFLGGILLTSTVLFALPPPPATMTEEEVAMEEQGITITNTPMDNFPDDQRATFCGIGDPKSTSYVKEYEIPTVCTQPLAIKVAPDGNVWFVESNTGKIAKFNPVSEIFTEFENDLWPEGARTMSWGMDYSPDGKMWYTDGSFDSIWRFDTINEEYDAVSYPVSEEGSLPQKLTIHGSNIIVNDFTGSKITFLDLTQNTDEITYSSVVAPIPNSFTGDFGIDSQNNLWYTNWVPETTGLLLKFNIEQYKQDSYLVGTGVDIPLEDYFEVYDFPQDLNTANGLSIDENDNVWIVDTSSSFFFKFNPNDETFTKFVTSKPQLSTYGNATGVIKSPISRPYWSQTDMNGNLFFNEQTSNQLAVFDIGNAQLVEYMVPSKNPNWADCEDKSKSNCGVAQIFGFDVMDDKIWFTEWAENKIGVVDLNKPLPFTVKINDESITLKKGETKTVTLSVKHSSSNVEDIEFNFAHTASSVTLSSDISVSHNFLNPNEISVSITASEISLSGDYKLLLGISNSEVTISKYIDVTIEP